MKQFLRLILLISLVSSLSSCATILGGKLSECQRTKPSVGQPSRQVRAGALIADVLLFWPGAIVDFATGAIYKPCVTGTSTVGTVSSASVTNSYKSSGGQYSNVIGNPIDLGTILVAEFDFPESLTYYDAKQKANAVGDGWRLPTKEEHQGAICLNKSRIPNLLAVAYWSGTESDKYDMQGTNGVQAINVFNKIMYLPCDNGTWNYITDGSSLKYRVRLVKSK